ncbi:carbohydrate ABC transporter permease [Microbacterium sp. 179-I 3D3 NHS]|uniref:carbohydrate ABC transporter permease n=1 Tax=unclassified Microbacterium TaxID=2609290 RepID=UPI0039A07BB7
MSRIRQSDRLRLHHALRVLAVIAVTALVLFPVYWMIVTAIQPLDASLRFPPPLVPISIDIGPMADVLTAVPLPLWLTNSALVAIATMILTTVLSVFGAYALSSLRWRGKLVFGFGLLLTQMMPEAVIVVPIFGMYKDLGLLQSLISLSLLHAAFVLPVCIWILKGAFDRVPDSVQEAALIDGCGQLGVLWRMVLPLSLPAVVSVAVVAFFASWGEYLFATTLISRAELYPASVGLATMISQLDTPVGELLSAGLLYALLPVILYMIAQKYVIAGMTAGAVKG